MEFSSFLVCVFVPFCFILDSAISNVFVGPVSFLRLGF
ncbi:putative membrane protein [Synechococcus sp. SYN20]|nr:putative membrane protein [Synechococcus sp. SYN20]